jgi:hypothetical protein
VPLPKKFVGLHAHTGFSAFDGLGYPDEHFKFCKENGLDAHAITEHGHCNSYAHAQLFVEKWKSAGENFKYIPGVEAYFHPDLQQWQRDKEEHDLAATEKKTAAKLLKKQEELQTKLVAVVDQNDETEDIEVSNALTIEDEEETKTTKHFNPINRRLHLRRIEDDGSGRSRLEVHPAVSPHLHQQCSLQLGQGGVGGRLRRDFTHEWIPVFSISASKLASGSSRLRSKLAPTRE